jgi:hypothetical protein
MFPDQCKIAKVVPIFKKGETNKFSNYRPVSVLPAISKILERLMYNRLIKFVDHFNIIQSNQFGFRKNYSTSLAINSFVNLFHEAIEKDHYMISLFIDLSRAFDTISHEILFNKLYVYGIRGLALDWIKNYLPNRNQFVIYNNMKSSFRNILMGVPQGSILGPLIFILYINDLPNVSSKLSFIQFADDTSIFITGKNLNEMSKLMTDQMKQVTDWLKINMLTLNISKTNYMIMCSRGKKVDDFECNMEIDGKLIECKAQCKFLGLIVDDKLTWKYHIDYICNKVSKLIGILFRARKMLSTSSLTTLYNSLVKPYFTYCINTWGNTFKTHLQRIEI